MLSFAIIKRIFSIIYDVYNGKILHYAKLELYKVIRMISELCQEFYCLRYISGNLLILSEHMEKIK